MVASLTPGIRQSSMISPPSCASLGRHNLKVVRYYPPPPRPPPAPRETGLLILRRPVFSHGHDLHHQRSYLGISAPASRQPARPFKLRCESSIPLPKSRFPTLQFYRLTTPYRYALSACFGGSDHYHLRWPPSQSDVAAITQFDSKLAFCGNRVTGNC